MSINNISGNLMSARSGKTSIQLLLLLSIPFLLLAGAGAYLLLARLTANSGGTSKPKNRKHDINPPSKKVRKKIKKQVSRELSMDFPERNFQIEVLPSVILCVEKSPSLPRQSWTKKARQLLTGLREHLISLHLFTSPGENTKPVRIVVLRSKEIYNRYLKKQQYPHFQNSHYDPSRRRAITFYDPESPYRRLLHEATHIYTGGRSPKTDRFPFWSMEGISMIMETGFLTRKNTFRTKIWNRKRMADWERMRNSGHMLSLKELVHLTHVDFTALLQKSSSTQRTRRGIAIYAQVWGLTCYLHKKFGRSRLVKYIQKSKTESNQPETLFEKVFGNLKKIEKRYLKFVDQKISSQKNH